MLPTSTEIRELGARLLGRDLIVFPVRHHSPACAWQLQQMLRTITPCAVLIEGPRSFSSLLPLLAHPDARMPMAIYTYAVEKAKADEAAPRHAAYYPFCDHSPELVALHEASARGIPTRFIDLDFAEQCQIETANDDAEAQSLLDERYYRRSRYLQALATQLGCRDHEELWEHLFEIPAATRDLAEHMADLAAYCHLARIDCSEDELNADGTLQREAEMAFHIRQALSERQPDDGPVLAIVGGFHAVALPDQLARETSRPKISRSAISDESSALIRYSDDRLDRLNGYSAGMTSPAWHRRIWERLQKHDKAGIEAGSRVRQEVALGILFDIAIELRDKFSVPLPMPTLRAAYEQALHLAELRNRAAPARADVLDAVTSCFVKGDVDADGALVLAVAQRFLSGQTMGKVPPGAGTPPLVKDFTYRARRQRLKIDESVPRRSVLDIYRRPEHRVTSRLFHGLTLLGVPFAVRTAGPDFINGRSLERLQEHWEYTHTAATEGALVEASVYGVTVPLAVANRFAARLDDFDAGKEFRSAKTAAALLAQACVLGLHDHLPRLIATLHQTVGADAAFESVVSAAGSLGLLHESREPLEARDLAGLLPLLRATYERALYLGHDLRNPAGDGSETVSALARLRELLVSAAGRDLDASLYWQLVARLAANHASPLLCGAATGLMYSAGRLTEAELGTVLAGNLGSGQLPRDAVGFLRGLLQTAREAAWQQPALLDILNGLLADWSDDDFVAMLPELRLAFAEMTPNETDRIADAVTQLHGGADLGRLVRHDLAAEQVQANLETSNRVLDLLMTDGLQAWVGA